MEATRIIFGIDIDDVLCQTSALMIKIFKELYGVEIDFNRLTSYHFSEIKGFPLTKEQVVRAYDKFHQGDSLRAEPVAGAREALLILRACGHCLWLPTARPEWVRGDTEKLLAKYNYLYDKLIFSNQKHLITEVDYWVEDNGSQAKLLAEAGKIVFLITRPWNRRVRKHPNIVRVKNWMEILDWLRFFKVIR